jgi:chromosome segregation protein
MYLKHLRIRGFKSFPGTVELRFHDGIAVIVGPNGSGKSNIADALQWAMAAQAPAQLRAPNGQDVLFSGSDGRPPAGVCEVELVLDNECGTLPLEFGEVSVMRRLHRESDGEYFINRSRVRRLDVLELLADTGLGREMHSVIGQGRVEEILLSKPHERRRFVEEAAGLGKYQRRRTRAEGKLVRVAGELERARDLEREVRARLRPLAMQATAAERAAKLAGEIAAGRIALLSSDMLVERRRSDGLQAGLGQAAASRAEVEARLALLAGRRGTAESELTGLAAAQERAAHAFYAFETARDRLALQVGRLEQAQASLERSLVRREAALGRLDEEATRFDEESRLAASAAAATAAEAGSEPLGDERAAQEAAAAAEAALSETLDARRTLAEAQGRAATARREADGLAARVQATGERVTGLVAAAEAAAAELKTVGAETDRLESAAVEAAAALVLAAEAGTAATLTETEQADAERAAAAGRDDVRQQLELARNRLRSLEHTLDRGEGLSPAARALSAAGATLVVAGVEAEPGFERAVAAALGWRAGAVIAGRIDEAVELLRSADGELGVILARPGHDDVAADPPAGARRLLDVVRVRDASVQRLISDVWVVEDLTRVVSGVAVTVAGEGVDADRGELWRTADAGEAVWLAARADRDRTSGEVERLETALAEAESSHGAAATLAAAATAAASNARASLADARSRETEAADAARGASTRRAVLTDELARCDASRDLALRDLEVDGARRSELESAAQTFAAQEVERRQAATAADERHAQLELRRRELAGEAARIAARVAGLHERQERFAQDAFRLHEAATASRVTAVRARELVAGTSAVGPLITALREQLRSAAGSAERMRAPARAGVETIERRAAELAAELQVCAELEAADQAALREAAQAATEVEVSLARSSERVSELERRRSELSGEHPELAVSEPDEPLPVDEAAAVAARLERLERRRESLGAVNPLAAEEYELEKGRASELEAQCDDLERSLKELRGLIRDLTQTIDRRFAETFADVAKHFTETIGTLFPGGSGRLRLTDDVVDARPAERTDDGEPVDPPDAGGGEPGIELEVRPAGKRIESLSLLSGGEKSLTAIAFLFALMLTKPSPFYVLDEVEAALDDANIERFLSLLRAYQSRAQFIVITHQRRTMEVADVLYGVSMAGDGESKVLSRKMPAEADVHHALDSA